MTVSRRDFLKGIVGITLTTIPCLSRNEDSATSLVSSDIIVNHKTPLRLFFDAKINGGEWGHIDLILDPLNTNFQDVGNGLKVRFHEDRLYFKVGADTIDFGRMYVESNTPKPNPVKALKKSKKVPYYREQGYKRNRYY